MLSICCPRFLCVWTRPFLLLLCNTCVVSYQSISVSRNGVWPHVTRPLHFHFASYTYAWQLPQNCLSEAAVLSISFNMSGQTTCAVSTWNKSVANYRNLSASNLKESGVSPAPTPTPPPYPPAPLTPCPQPPPNASWGVGGSNLATTRAVCVLNCWQLEAAHIPLIELWLARKRCCS